MSNVYQHPLTIQVCVSPIPGEMAWVSRTIQGIRTWNTPCECHACQGMPQCIGSQDVYLDIEVDSLYVVANHGTFLKIHRNPVMYVQMPTAQSEAQQAEERASEAESEAVEAEEEALAAQAEAVEAEARAPTQHHTYDGDGEAPATQAEAVKEEARVSAQANVIVNEEKAQLATTSASKSAGNDNNLEEKIEILKKCLEDMKPLYDTQQTCHETWKAAKESKKSGGTPMNQRDFIKVQRTRTKNQRMWIKIYDEKYLPALEALKKESSINVEDLLKKLVESCPNQNLERCEKVPNWQTKFENSRKIFQMMVDKDITSSQQIWDKQAKPKMSAYVEQALEKQFAKEQKHNN